MRLFCVTATAASMVFLAGCGWSPPGAPAVQPDTCTPADGPTAGTVAAEIQALPASPAGGQWTETARGNTTDCRLYWVQVGVADPAPDGAGQLVFFDHDTPIGTPTPEPRPYLAVVNSGQDTVTVQYQWRQGDDQPCCPTGIGTVRFRVGDGDLEALDPVPNS